MNTFYCWKGKYDSKFLSQLSESNIAKKIYMLLEKSVANLPDFIPHTGADTVYPEANIELPKSLEDYTNPSKIVIIILGEFCNDG